MYVFMYVCMYVCMCIYIYVICCYMYTLHCITYILWLYVYIYVPLDRVIANICVGLGKGRIKNKQFAKFPKGDYEGSERSQEEKNCTQLRCTFLGGNFWYKTGVDMPTTAKLLAVAWSNAILYSSRPVSLSLYLSNCLLLFFQLLSFFDVRSLAFVLSHAFDLPPLFALGHFSMAPHPTIQHVWCPGSHTGDGHPSSQCLGERLCTSEPERKPGKITRHRLHISDG